MTCSSCGLEIEDDEESFKCDSCPLGKNQYHEYCDPGWRYVGGFAFCENHIPEPCRR